MLVPAKKVGAGLLMRALVQALVPQASFPPQLACVRPAVSASVMPNC